MKEEDADWLIYHLIAQKGEITADELANESGLDAPAVAASLDRLDRYLLINRTGGMVRALSVGEALVKCQARYDETVPYIIENGVIKARKN
ncbi:MAG: winged helix-turn-helix transcriptional regulator [Methanoregula sp.]|uniref:winged helix-turn-helix transcriptional regulator n=1 Tax=Methanoregula sp. TaxID=2052170 RepID=UPI003C1B962D